MLSTICRTIEREQLRADGPAASGGHRWLVAVSGGPDSTALLHALVQLAPRLYLTLEAATVDHGLRPESAGEAAQVHASCRALGVPCQVLRVDVTGARGPHVSLQDAARRVRLAALAEAARSTGCQRVALGHTADDQAETVLFRIVRGTGVAGLTGIPYARPPFIRPLLDVRRGQLLAFLRRRKVSFIEDPSNADRRFTRSRVRHDWLPFLERENPRLVDALLSLAADSRALSGSAAPPGELARRVGRRAAATVSELASQGRGTRWVHFAGGVAEVAYGRVELRPAGVPAKRQADLPALPEMYITQPGQYRWPGGAPQGGSLEIEVQLRQGGLAPRGSTSFAAAVLTSGLHLRAPRPGDRMRPRGGAGSRKLQDLLVDAKIPRERRRTLPVLCTAGGTILLVPGLRPSEAGRPEPGSREWVEIRIRPTAEPSGARSVG